MIFSAVVLILIQISRKKNDQLEEKNKQIDNQHEQLKVVASELESTNKIKDRFFSIIAHDLKSPFNSLLGLSDILHESVENYAKKEIVEISGAINQSSHRAFNLLENLLEWARTQTNRIVYEPTNIDVSKLIKTNIELSESAANAKSIALIFDAQTKISVVADENMFNTIIRNLISNAIKFTSEGSIKVDAKDEKGKCLISVIDTGIGIKKDKIEDIFKLDKNVSTVGTKGETGTGLGLILCKEFVEKNKGEFFVESVENQGSVFSFSLPLSN